MKQAGSVPQTAAYYGMKAQHSRTCCILHDYHHPSMKLNDTYYYCFACLAHGNVIDQVSQLHRESHYVAVQPLSRCFGIYPTVSASAAAKPCIPRRNVDKAHCMTVFTDYERLLKYRQH